MSRYYAATSLIVFGKSIELRLAVSNGIVSLAVLPIDLAWAICGLPSAPLLFVNSDTCQACARIIRHDDVLIADDHL